MTVEGLISCRCPLPNLLASQTAPSVVYNRLRPKPSTKMPPRHFIRSSPNFTSIFRHLSEYVLVVCASLFIILFISIFLCIIFLHSLRIKICIILQGAKKTKTGLNFRSQSHLCRPHFGNFIIIIIIILFVHKTVS